MDGKNPFATPGQNNTDKSAENIKNMQNSVRKRTELYGAVWESELRKSSFETIDWFKRGRDLHAMGKYEEAMQAFNNFIQFYPHNSLVWRWKGATLINLGEYKNAVQALDEAIRLDPDEAETWNNKGFALECLGEHKKALQALNKSIRLRPNSAITWNTKGHTLEALGEYKKAKTAFAKAKELGMGPNPVYSLYP